MLSAVAVLVLALVWPDPAAAGPVLAALGGLFAGGTGFGGLLAGAAGAFAKSIVGRLLISVAVSSLTRAMQPRPRPAGIRSSTTQSGGVTPVSFVLGRFATTGFAVCPPMSHGENNAFLTYVLDVGDIPGAGLSRLMIDGEYVTLGSPDHADYGTPVTGRFLDKAWVIFHDGHQTVADAMLLDKYGSYPERPWTSDMVLTGVSYAILTFSFDTDTFTGPPRVRFEIDGPPLYDIRADSTAGGSGAQRWADPSTWAPTRNPAVMIWNILRGITLGDGSVWGLGLDAADIDQPGFVAAMNDCDAAVPLAGGGTQPAYRAGYEVLGADEPVDGGPPQII